MGGSIAGAVAAGAGASGATAAALGLEEIGIVEMTRGTGASRMSIDCSFSLEPARVMDALEHRAVHAWGTSSSPQRMLLNVGLSPGSLDRPDPKSNRQVSNSVEAATA